VEYITTLMSIKTHKLLFIVIYFVKVTEGFRNIALLATIKNITGHDPQRSHGNAGG